MSIGRDKGYSVVDRSRQYTNCNGSSVQGEGDECFD